MAISDSFYLYNNKNLPWEGRIDYTLTDDAVNNRTRVQVKLYTYKTEDEPSGSNTKLFEPTITIDGITYEGTSYDTERSYKAAQEETRHLRQSVDVYVNHDSTGSKSLTISGRVYKDYVNSDGYPTELDYSYIYGSKTLTLTDYITGYTLTYDANGGYGAPSSVSNVTSTTISDIIPIRDGYEFLCWLKFHPTDSITYAAGDSITLTANTTLYAVWTQNFTLTYDANGGSGTISSQTATEGSVITLSSNSFTAPTYPVWTLTLDGNGGNDGSPTFKGNYFNKWRTGPTLGLEYSEGDSYTIDGDVTMYAWWGTKYIWGTTTRDPVYAEGYTVSFDANGGTCATSSLTSTIITSYDFLGWGKSASNPTTTFKSNKIYNQTSNYTAYAIWSSPITTNGSITLPTPIRNGYEFLGWSADEFDTNGLIGEYAPDGDMTLYAIWKPMGNVYIYDDTEAFNPYQVLIYDGSGWNQYIPYIYTESGWEMYS